MKLSELMKQTQTEEGFSGFVTCDDWVLAVSVSGRETAPPDFETVQAGIVGVEAQMNPVTQEKQYIRSGKSTMKTGVQRTFVITGDRCVGDPFQDYALSPEIRCGSGQSVIVSYVYFCLLNGRGERGEASILVDCDGSGTAGEGAAIRLRLQQSGSMPEEFLWAGLPEPSPGG